MTQQEKDAQGIIKIKNNEYMKVSGRVLAIHKKYPDCVAITSEILSENDSCLTVKSTVVVTDEKGVREFSGHAREYFDFDDRKSVNFAFCLENAETSAIGRAIGSAGVGLIPGSAFASADEMQRIEARTTARDSQIPKEPEDQESKDEPVEPRIHDDQDQKPEIEQLRTQVKDLRVKLNWEQDDLMAIAQERYPNLPEWKNIKITQFKWIIWRLESELKKLKKAQ